MADNEKEIEESSPNTDTIIDDSSDKKACIDLQKGNKGKIFNVKNPIFIVLILFFVIIISSLTFWFVKNNNLINSYSNKVYPISYVFETDVSGFTTEELHNTLENMLNNISNKKFVITVGDKTFDINYKDLDTTIDYNAFQNNILEYGKNKPFFEKLKLIKEPTKKNYTFTLSYNEEKLKEFVNHISENVNVTPKNSSIDISGTSIKISDGSDGTVLNADELLNNLKASIEKITNNEVTSFTGNLEVVKPNIETQTLQGVNKKIASFSTNSPAGPSGYNASLAIKNIDNILIMPGDSFSTEKAIGPTTAERGFVSSNIYLNGKVEKGYGGGVCQISSTLYNTMLRAGILPTERLNHSMPVNYVPLGLDATLADGYIDLKFKNPYDYPIVINSYVDNGKATVEFWSNDSVLKGIRYEPKAIQTSPLNAETYLYGYNKDGQVVYEKFVDKSTYQPLPQ